MTNASGPEADARPGRTLFAGSASGPVVRLDEPLSLWGGMDPATGTVIDRRHPQSGEDLAGRVVLMPSGRGSSSSSSVLAEAVRAQSFAVIHRFMLEESSLKSDAIEIIHFFLQRGVRLIWIESDVLLVGQRFDG